MSKPAPKPEEPKKEENPSQPAENTKMQDEGEKKDQSKIDEEK